MISEGGTHPQGITISNLITPSERVGTRGDDPDRGCSKRTTPRTERGRRASDRSHVYAFENGDLLELPVAYDGFTLKATIDSDAGGD